MKFFRFGAILLTLSLLGSCSYFATNKKQLSIGEKTEISQPLTVEDIDKIAQEITVLIRGNPDGSGILIAKEKGLVTNTYWVLTAKHVIKAEGEYQIVTPDGQEYTIKPENYNNQITKFDNFDLGLIKFKSKYDYQIAVLTDYNFENKNTYFDGHKQAKSISFVAGFPDPKQNTNFLDENLILTPGYLSNRLDSIFIMGQGEYIADNYDYAYTNITYRGMSGGAVLDSSGRVVAVHGRNSGEITAENKPIILGYSLGTPIIYFLNYIKTTDMSLPLSIVSSEPTALSEKISSKYYIQNVTGCFNYIDCLNLSNNIFRMGNYTQALEVINTSISSNPNFYASWYLRGQILFGLRNIEEAAYSYEKSLQLKPDHEQSLYAKCAIIIGENNNKKALECLNNILLINPNSFMAWHSKSDILTRIGEYKLAIEALDNSLKIKPNAHGYNNRGYRKFAYIDQKDAAIKDFTLAIEVNPTFAPAYVNRGLSYRSLGNNQDAEADFKKSIQVNPEYAAQALFDFHEYPFALQAYEELVRLHPNDATIYCDLGKVRLQLEDNERAIQDLSRAIQLDPNFAEAYLTRGKAYSKTGNLKNAKQDFLKISNLPINSESPENYYNRGLAKHFLGNHQEALVDFNQSLAFYEDNMWLNLRDTDYFEQIKIYSYRGSSYSAIGKYKEAIEDFNKALGDLNNGSETRYIYVPAYFHRGLTYLNLKNFEKSISDFSKMLDSIPNDIDSYFYRGNAYLNLGNYKQAIKDYTQAIEFSPDFAESYYNRGKALFSIKGIIEIELPTGEKIRFFDEDVSDMYQDFKKAAELAKKQNNIELYNQVQEAVQNINLYVKPKLSENKEEASRQIQEAIDELNQL